MSENLQKKGHWIQFLIVQLFFLNKFSYCNRQRTGRKLDLQCRLKIINIMPNFGSISDLIERRKSKQNSHLPAFCDSSISSMAG